MFDAEKLLGGLMKSKLLKNKSKLLKKAPGLARKVTSPGFGTGPKAAIGMGALGVAFGAFEHFTGKKDNDPSPQGRGPAPHFGAGAPPPPPAQAGGRVAPPPPPGAAPAFAPPPSPAPSAPSAPQAPASLQQQNALLLIRAMIAAANADGHIDQEERGAVLKQLQDSGFGQEERDFVMTEMNHPRSVDSLLPQVDSPQLGQQFYIASLLAIRVDTQAERDYLDYLARRLGLDESARAGIHERFQQ